MKISLISGIKTSSAESLAGNNNGIGRTYKEWAEAVNYWNTLSATQKGKIVANNVNPLNVSGREILKQIIKKNGGGLADFLYSISPFNTKGKIDQNLYSKWQSAWRDYVNLVNKQYPVDSTWLASYRSKVTVSTQSGPLTIPTAKVPNTQATAQARQWEQNLITRENLKLKKVAELNKTYPYLVYPASNQKGWKQYRNIEIKWLLQGGNPDDLNKAVKEGITKSPRGADFNYLLGKMKSGTFKTADYGLAIKSVLALLVGGTRFNLRDAGVWTPWGGWKPGKLNGPVKGIGAEPVSTTAAVSVTVKYWVGIAISLITLLLPYLFKKDEEETLTTDQGWNNPEYNNAMPGGSAIDNLPSWAIPVGLGVGAYFLLGDE